MEKCKYEGDIQVMKKQLGDMERVLFTGNGKESLTEGMTIMRTEMKSVKSNVSDIKESVETILQHIYTEKGKDAGKDVIDKGILTKWQKTAIVLTAVFSFCALVISLIKLGGMV